MDYQNLEHQNLYPFLSTQIGSPSQHAGQSPSQMHQPHHPTFAGPVDTKHSAGPSAGLQHPRGQANDFLPQAYPSPTSILYTNNGLPQGRMSARWDTAQFALPPSSDVSFGMPGMIPGMQGTHGVGMPMSMGLDAGMAGHMTFPISMPMAMGEEDMMLHDFGAALAQADEMADGEWQ